MTKRLVTLVEDRPLVTFVLPAKDEAEAIGKVLAGLPTETLDLMGFDSEKVVLDGDSHDGTRDIVYGHGGASVVFGDGKGKARALREARDELHGDYILMLDGDGTYAPDAIPRILAPLIRDEADIVMGRRSIQPGSMSLIHRIGNRALSWMARLLYGGSCPDLCTGMWGFQAHALGSLPLQATGFELEAEMFAEASRLGLRIENAPIDYLPRLGASSLTTRDGLKIAWCLLRSRWRDLGAARPPPDPRRMVPRPNRDPP